MWMISGEGQKHWGCRVSHKQNSRRTGVLRAGKWPDPQVPHSEAFAPPAVCGIQKANIEDESKENLVSSTEFPWVVSIQDQEYTHLTFGCILSEFWILSSASALQDRLVPQREGWEGPQQAWGLVGATHLRVCSPESRSWGHQRLLGLYYEDPEVAPVKSKASFVVSSKFIWDFAATTEMRILNSIHQVSFRDKLRKSAGFLGPRKCYCYRQKNPEKNWRKSDMPLDAFLWVLRAWLCPPIVLVCVLQIIYHKLNFLQLRKKTIINMIKGNIWQTF